MRGVLVLVAAASTPALADDYDDCRATRHAIYARARLAADHLAYERVLRSAPDCEAAVPIPALPPARDVDDADDTFRPARLGAIDARWPTMDRTTPPPPPVASVDPDPILIEDDPPPPVTPLETHKVAHPRTGKPPLSAGRIIGEVLGGAAAATGGAFVGGLIGYSVACTNACSTSTNETGIGIGALMGGTLALGVGVWAVGDGDGQTGSVGAAVGGGVAGLLAGTLLAALTSDLIQGTSYNSTTRTVGETLEVVFVLGGPIGGSLLGFNLTRRYVSGGVGSLVRVDGGRVAVGVPVAVPTATGATLSVVSGRF